MDKRKPHPTGILLSFILVIVILAGCGNDGSVGGKSGGQDVIDISMTEGDGEEHEPLTLCTAGMNYTCFIDALHEKYPEINIELISYQGGNASAYMENQLENGDIPDIFTAGYVQEEELQKKYLLDLSSYDFVNNYSETMLNQVDVDGAIYMLPSRYQVAGINYNKTMFEEHGWQVPQSFEELQELVAQIEEEAPDVTPIMARMSLKVFPFQYLFALGDTGFLGTQEGSEWEKDFMEGSDTAVGNLEDAARYLGKWIDAGYITDYNLDGTDIMSDFYDGKIAMVLGTGTSRWTCVGKTTGETIDVGIMAWPGENGNHGILLSNVSRYYGINKELAEPGNEQKLQDALKVMAYMATEEGQEALASGSCNGVAFPFENYRVNEDSPLYEVKDYIEKGYTVQLDYAGWDDLLLSPMADEITKFIQGKIDADELLKRFDEINTQVRKNPDSECYATLDEDLTQEQAARLAGMAMIEYTDADVALVSMGGITDDGYNLENPTGVQCGIHAGGVDEEIVSMFRPYSSQMATVELTGAEIKELEETGRELHADPEAMETEYTYLEEPFTYYMPYVMTAKDDAELVDNKTYRVVFSAGDYCDTLAESWGENLTLTENSDSGTAIVAWLQQFDDGHFDSSDLAW